MGRGENIRNVDTFPPYGGCAGVDHQAAVGQLRRDATVPQGQQSSAGAHTSTRIDVRPSHQRAQEGSRCHYLLTHSSRSPFHAGKQVGVSLGFFHFCFRSSLPDIVVASGLFVLPPHFHAPLLMYIRRRYINVVVAVVRAIQRVKRECVTIMIRPTAAPERRSFAHCGHCVAKYRPT